MNVEQQLIQIIENQKQMIDIENYKHYQHAIDVFFFPAEVLNISLHVDLKALRADLVEDSRSNPPFAAIQVSKYSDRLSEMIDNYVNVGKNLGRPYANLGRRQIKNSLEIILMMESIRNKITQIVIEDQDANDVLKLMDKTEKLIFENIQLSREIMEILSKKMVEINSRLDRDYSKYSLKNKKLDLDLIF